MEIRYKDGLLYTSLEITYKGKSKIIKDIIIDTGVAHSLIDPDEVFDIDISFESGDRFITMYEIGGEEHAFAKIIDDIKIGNSIINDYDMHFGIVDPRGEIKGLLGLDLLVKAGVIIDLNNMQIYQIKDKQ